MWLFDNVALVFLRGRSARSAPFVQEAFLMKLSHFCSGMLFFLACLGGSVGLFAADKLIGFYSARTMSQAMPWIAEETGLFRKYDLDFQLVYISAGYSRAAQRR